MERKGREGRKEEVARRGEVRGELDSPRVPRVTVQNKILLVVGPKIGDGGSGSSTRPAQITPSEIGADIEKREP